MRRTERWGAGASAGASVTDSTRDRRTRAPATASTLPPGLQANWAAPSGPSSSLVKVAMCRCEGQGWAGLDGWYERQGDSASGGWAAAARPGQANWRWRRSPEPTHHVWSRPSSRLRPDQPCSSCRYCGMVPSACLAAPSPLPSLQPITSVQRGPAGLDHPCRAALSQCVTFGATAAQLACRIACSRLTVVPDRRPASHAPRRGPNPLPPGPVQRGPGRPGGPAWRDRPAGRG